MTEISKVGNSQQNAAIRREKQVQTETQEESMLSIMWDGFTGYYKEKFEGTKDIKDALSRTGEILNEGFEQIDDASGLTSAKQKIKDYAEVVDKYVDDGDDSNLSCAEKAWEFTKNIGRKADVVVSSKGVTAGAFVAAGAIVAAPAVGTALSSGSATLAAAGHTTLSTIVGAMPAVAVDTAIVGGSTLAVYGIGEAAVADTKEEVNNGADKFVLGASIALLGKSFAPEAVKVAQAAQIPINSSSSALANCFAIPRNAATTIMQEKVAETSLLGVETLYLNPNKIPYVEETLDSSGKCISKKVITDGEVSSELNYKYNSDGKKVAETLRKQEVYDNKIVESQERTRFNPKTGKEVSKLNITTEKGVNPFSKEPFKDTYIKRAVFNEAGEVKSRVEMTGTPSGNSSNIPSRSMEGFSVNIKYFDPESGVSGPFKEIRVWDDKVAQAESFIHFFYNWGKNANGINAANAWLKEAYPCGYFDLDVVSGDKSLFGTLAY